MVALFAGAIADAALYRLTVEPTVANGFGVASQVMVDKVLAYPRAKCGPVVGRLSGTDMLVSNNMLSVMVGLAD